MKPNGQVHPATAVFPELDEDELSSLADDIAANGLREPIALLPDGTLLDGRNRLAACKRAKVIPSFVVYDGDDPASYVLSMNVARRHLSTGQRAMATAIVLAEAGMRESGRWRGGATKDRESGVSAKSWADALWRAGVVLDHAPDLASLVIAGEQALDAAYQQAHAIRTMANTVPERMKELRRTARDLAELVTEERMTLDEAEAAARHRVEEQEAHLRRVAEATDRFLSWVENQLATVAVRREVIEAASVNGRTIDVRRVASAIDRLSKLKEAMA